MKEHVRFPLEMSPGEHYYLKMVSTKLGISIPEFILLAAFEKLMKMEDEGLVLQAQKVLKRIKEGKEKLSPWSKTKKRT